MRKAELMLRAGANLMEGSIWDWEQGRLLWVDIFRGEVHAFDPVAGTDRLLCKPDSIVGCVVQREGGGLAAATQHGFCFVDETTGQAEPICELEGDLPGNRFNDGKCDPAGRLWAGSMDTRCKPGRGSLYRLGTDLRCDRMLDSVTISNGMAWSLDNSTMYYTDTATRVIWAFDYELETGAIRNRRAAVEIPGGEGGPDGFTVDAEGMLWVAQWGGWQVGRYNPHNGKKMDAVELPTVHVSSCAFGGSGLDELYITTAQDGLNEQQLAGQPLAGSLFVAKVGAKGTRANKFRG